MNGVSKEMVRIVDGDVQHPSGMLLNPDLGAGTPPAFCLWDTHCILRHLLTDACLLSASHKSPTRLSSKEGK